MEIWIRTQNKTGLHLILSVRTYKRDGMHHISGCISGGYHYELGEYATEERALDVLEQIERCIHVIEHNKMMLTQPDEQYNHSRHVYQMPQ